MEVESGAELEPEATPVRGTGEGEKLSEFPELTEKGEIGDDGLEGDGA